MSWLDLVYGKEATPLVSSEVPIETLYPRKGDWALNMAFGEEDLLAEQIAGDEVEQETLYRYTTALDDAVCPICKPLEGEVFPESAIPETFPDAEELAEGVVKANTHAPRDWNCRCELFAEDPPFQSGVIMDQSFNLDAEVMKYNAWAGGGL